MRAPFGQLRMRRVAAVADQVARVDRVASQSLLAATIHFGEAGGRSHGAEAAWESSRRTSSTPPTAARAAGMRVALFRIDAGRRCQRAEVARPRRRRARADAAAAGRRRLSRGPLSPRLRGGPPILRSRSAVLAEPAVPRRRADRLRHRRGRSALPRASARQPLVVLDLPRQLRPERSRRHGRLPLRLGSTCCCAGRMSSPASPGSARRSTSSASTASLTPPGRRKRSRQGHRRRALGGPRRRLLSPAEVPGRADAGCPSSCTGRCGRATRPGSPASPCSPCSTSSTPAPS